MFRLTLFTFAISIVSCNIVDSLVALQVVVQYDKDLLEVWDEAKRLRCEWFNDYEKTASKPPMVIADLDVIQLDFRGETQKNYCDCSLTNSTDSLFCFLR